MCSARIESVAREEGVWGSIVQQAVFLSDFRQVESCRRIMRDFYGDELPATSYIPQAPCGGELLADRDSGSRYEHVDSGNAAA